MHKVTQFDTIPVTIGPVVTAVGYEEVSRNTVWHVTWWLVETHHTICWLATWNVHVMLGLWLVGAQGGELTFMWSVHDQCMHTESLNVRRWLTKNQAAMACLVRNTYTVQVYLLAREEHSYQPVTLSLPKLLSVPDNTKTIARPYYTYIFIPVEKEQLAGITNLFTLPPSN